MANGDYNSTLLLAHRKTPGNGFVYTLTFGGDHWERRFTLAPLAGMERSHLNLQVLLHDIDPEVDESAIYLRCEYRS